MQQFLLLFVSVLFFPLSCIWSITQKLTLDFRRVLHQYALEVSKAVTLEQSVNEKQMHLQKWVTKFLCFLNKNILYASYQNYVILVFRNVVENFIWLLFTFILQQLSRYYCMHFCSGGKKHRHITVKMLRVYHFWFVVRFGGGGGGSISVSLNITCNEHIQHRILSPDAGNYCSVLCFQLKLS